jgi:phosphomannomutase
MSEELISAYDIRGTEETGLTVECAWNAGKALADWLPQDGNVVVAYTSDQEKIARGVIEGLRLQGRNVVDAGTSNKDFVTSYVVMGGLAGGVIVGFDDMEKVTTIELYREGGKLIDGETGLKDIHALVQAGNFVPAAIKGELTSISA